MNNTIKIICISDTHNQHSKLHIPECDILIHSGDFSYYGKYMEVTNFLAWFASTPAKHKIFIAGNHEMTLDKKHDRYKKEIYEVVKSYTDIIYLENSSVQLEGLNIYGTPHTPYFYDWGFNGISSSDLKNQGSVCLITTYDNIPTNTDILICHGPPRNILDLNRRKELCGSIDMLNRLSHLTSLKLYVCGHIHQSSGVVGKDNVTFINASVLDDSYTMRFPPREFNIDVPDKTV